MTAVKYLLALLALVLGVAAQAAPRSAVLRNTSDTHWILVLEGEPFGSLAHTRQFLLAGHQVAIPLYETAPQTQATIRLKDHKGHDDAEVAYLLDPGGEAMAVTLKADWEEEANVARVLRLEADQSLTILEPRFQSDDPDTLPLSDLPRPTPASIQPGSAARRLSF